MRGMREYVHGLAGTVRREVVAARHQAASRLVRGHSPGGDAQFGLDDVAEAAAWKYIVGQDLPVALYSEDGGLQHHGHAPEHLLVVDPIDGTRPAVAGLGLSTVSVAVAPLTGAPTIADVSHALLLELDTGASLYTERGSEGIEALGYDRTVPCLSSTAELDRMMWSLEFNGHPAALMTRAYGHLIDRSANTGGVFVFNSATFSISRLITGQLDAYVDIGNRLLREDPALLPEFRRVGNGAVLHLFPYDIAAAVLLAEQAGVTITDAFGKPLGDTVLTDLGVDNQRSCVAASTPELHRALLEAIRWHPEPATDPPRTVAEPPRTPAGPTSTAAGPTG
ncbi:inositol monophosphatase family protein [Streptomyces sp. NPDC093109]|uniref:inositol monophosphatase family protein n=1 Tax=Streptomyces sp. NPDC093109 TaxID=3154977 RepID=UPI00344E0C7B